MKAKGLSFKSCRTIACTTLLFSLMTMMSCTPGGSSSNNGSSDVVGHSWQSKGQERGNGSDNYDLADHAAWFLGERPIKYCMRVDSSFGMDPSFISAQLKDAFRQWHDYIENKKVNDLLQQLWENPYGHPRLPFKPLATRSEMLADCSGSQGTPDLEFYFGGTNTEIDNVKKQLSNPWAISNRRRYDPAVGWGNGFIWIAPAGSVLPNTGAPNWSLPQRLLGVLLHEIGHIYGVEHVPGTIMSENLRWRIEGNNNWSEEWAQWSLSNIDNERELFLAPLAPESIPEGYIAPRDLPLSESYELETFELMTGRKSRGNISAKIEKGFLVFEDNGGPTKLPFEIYDNGHLDWSEIDIGQNIFVYHMKDQAISLSSRHESKYGIVHAFNGTKITIQQERNAAGRIEFFYFNEGHRYYLFSPKKLTTSGWQ